ncbi:MAG: DNA topoisomerase, partial [Monoglobaceae bacterium]
RLTEGRLIAEMENISKYIDDKELKSIMKKTRGIGTQATRGEIISDLIKSGYIDKKKSGKNEFLYISDVGKRYIENLLNHDLVNPDLTAEWEEKLSDVEQGNKSPKEFSDEMKQYVEKTIGQIDSQPMQSATKPKSEKIGKCPCCGRGVFESKKGFYCEGFKDKNEKCEFFLWRDNPFLKKGHKTLTSTIVKQLLKTGTATVNGLQFQKGKKCSATAILETHDTGYSKINFEFLSKKSKI